MSAIDLQPNHSLLEMAWNHIRHEMLYISWALMEIALITPIALAFMPWARYWPPFLVAFWLLLLMLVPFNLARWMTLVKVPLAWQQRAMLAGLLLTLILSIHWLLFPDYAFFSRLWLAELYSHIAETSHPFWPRDFMVFWLVVLTWWRGMGIAGREVNLQKVGLLLRVGSLIVAPILIILGYARLAWDVTPFILLFMLASLTAVALTRAEEVELGRSGRSAAMSPRWLGAILAAAFLLILTTVVVAAAVGSRDILEVIGWLGPISLAAYFMGTVVWISLSNLIFPLTALLEWLINNIIWLIGEITRLIFSRRSEIVEDEAVGPIQRSLAEFIELVQPGEPLVSNRIVLLCLAVIIILIIAYSLNRMTRSIRLASQSGALAHPRHEQSAPLKAPSWGQRLLQKLGLWQQWRTAASIRRIYLQMSRAAGEYGYPRGESETPYEYLASLAKLWPEATAESRLITQAYVRVRYGEVPETQAELDEIRQAWEKLAKIKPPDMPQA